MKHNNYYTVFPLHNLMLIQSVEPPVQHLHLVMALMLTAAVVLTQLHQLNTLSMMGTRWKVAMIQFHEVSKVRISLSLYIVPKSTFVITNKVAWRKQSNTLQLIAICDNTVESEQQNYMIDCMLIVKLMSHYCDLRLVIMYAASWM